MLSSLLYFCSTSRLEITLFSFLLLLLLLLFFQHTEDIFCRLTYDDSEDAPFTPGIDRTIGVFNISGIAAFSKEVAEKGLGEPKVHLSFTLDASGIVSLTKAEATVELPLVVEESGSISESETTVGEGEATETTVESTADESTATEDKDIEKEKDTDDKTEGTEKEDGVEKDTDADSETNEAEANTDDERDSKKKDEKEKKDKKDKKKEKKDKKKKEKKVKAETQLKRTLVVEEDISAPTPAVMSPTRLLASKKKLTRLAKADEARKAKETALNDLEAYVYKIRNRLRDEDGKDQLGKVSTEEQREEIIAACNDIEDWLYDEGRSADLSEFKTKEGEIQVPADKIFKRFKESQDRPKAVKRALKQLQNVTKKIDSWGTGEKMAHITEEELLPLRELMAGVQDWVAVKVEAQEAADPYDEAVFSSYEGKISDALVVMRHQAIEAGCLFDMIVR